MCRVDEIRRRHKITFFCYIYGLFKAESLVKETQQSSFFHHILLNKVNKFLLL